MFSKKEVIFQRFFPSKLLLNYFCRERQRKGNRFFLFLFLMRLEIIQNVILSQRKRRRRFRKIFSFEIIIIIKLFPQRETEEGESFLFIFIFDEVGNYLERHSFSKEGKKEVIFERFFLSKLLLNYFCRERQRSLFLFLFLMGQEIIWNVLKEEFSKDSSLRNYYYY